MDAVSGLQLPGLLYPAWIAAAAGTVTLPHLDKDNYLNPIGTSIVMLEGEQLFMAWEEASPREEACILEELTGPYPSFTRMLAQPRLTVAVMSAGDVVCMPAGTMHMVVTSVPKLALSCHHR